MKKFSLYLTVILFFHFHYVSSQNQLNCHMANTSSNSQVAPPIACWPEDGEIYNYIPNANMPTLTFKVNFVFFRHTTQNLVYSLLSHQQLITLCNQKLAYINSKFNACGNISPSLPSPNPSSLVQNPKIQFVLNNVYTPTDDNYAISPTKNIAWGATPYDYDANTAINIYYFYSYAAGVFGGGNAIPGHLNMVNYAGDPPVSSNNPPNGADDADLVWHELCHAVGYLKDHYLVAGNSVAYTMGDPAINGISYIPDDAAVDLPTSLPGCNSLNNNNNVMGETYCKEHLSARQIAAFHYLVAKDVTKKYTQFNGQNYPYSINNTPGNITYNSLQGVQVINANSLPKPFGTITIKPGANVLIKNGSLTPAANGKIIVEPGGKLRMECVEITTYNSSVLWDGIEVWGNKNQMQTIGSNNLSMNQGILELQSCKITHAKVGVLVGKRLGAGNFSYYNGDAGSGGGIVKVKSTRFNDNWKCVYMSPKTPPYSGTQNLSTFEDCFLETNSNFFQQYPGATNVLVELRGVREVKFYGNRFKFFQNSNLNQYDTTICLKASYSSIWTKRPTGGGINNSFELAYYGIYMNNSSFSKIEVCQFTCINGIYANNSANDKIVNNSINLNYVNNGPYNAGIRTGLYLNACTNFKVEKNTFYSATSSPYTTEGICVNNSGVLPNQIYNNTFNALDQGIWCQGTNYNAQSLTGDGLKLNCNVFTNCDFNIGVQTPFSPPNNTGGIATTQGIAGASDAQNSRNSYSSPNCSNENKFYSFTPWSNPPQVQHGNFLGSQFRVGPQPSCSDFTDINDIPGLLGPLTNFSGYCPDNSSLPNANKAELTSTISDLNSLIDQLGTEYESKLDKENTAGLLFIIGNPGIIPSIKRDSLLSPDFLSDTVMKRYFSDSSTPSNYVRDVFVKNAPVKPIVFEAVATRTLENNHLASIDSAQALASLSPRSLLLARLALAQNERSYTIMHKSMYFMGDSNMTHFMKRDSIKAIIQLNDNGDIEKQLIELDLDFGDYSSALQRIEAYNDPEDALRSAYCGYKSMFVILMQDSLGIQALATNTMLLSNVESVALNDAHPCTIEARGLLFSVFSNKFSPELKLTPEENQGSRLLAPTTSNQTKKGNLAKDLLFYPNPAQNEFFIENRREQAYELRIYNILGQLYIKELLDARVERKISLGALPNGIYLINLYEGEKLYKSEKLIIAH